MKGLKYSFVHDDRHISYALAGSGELFVWGSKSNFGSDNYKLPMKFLNKEYFEGKSQ